MYQSRPGGRHVELIRTHWEIASVTAGFVGVGLGFGDDDANARLIAAAPDLLAVAKLALRLCDPELVARDPTAASLKSLAEAAIKKAAPA